MLAKKFIPLIFRTYCCAPVNPLAVSDVFSTQRKNSLFEKVSKLKANPVNSRVVDEGKVDLLNRAAVLVPLISVDGEPGYTKFY